MKIFGHWDADRKFYFISIRYNERTFKTVLEIRNEFYTVDFNASTIRTILGFERDI